MGAASFAEENARKIREHKARMQAQYSDMSEHEQTEDLGKKATQLLRMNKNALCKYGSTLGLNLDPDLPKETLIDMIQRKEQE